MKHSIKKLVAGTALALGALGAFAADPIKIGSVLSVTGPAAFLGDPELKTLQLYVDDLNKKGGVLGRPLQLVHYDDGSDANKANGFTKRLIEDDKVDVLVGGTTTGATMSSVPLAEKAGIPFRLKTPHKAFHRNIGALAQVKVSPDGRVLSEAEWKANVDNWLPSETDRAFVGSLMGRVVEPGKFANWIAPPPMGINKQPIDFDYIRFA